MPSLPEQTAIATYLDRKTAQIDTLITKKQRLIELLCEERTAIISHAVTKGLDATVPLKDSGVEWIGEIPEHWVLAPVYARFSVQLGKMLDSKRVTGKSLAPYLRNIDVQWDKININDLPQMDFSDSDKVKFALKQGDLLVCEGGEVGRAAIWQSQLSECYYQKALHRIRPLSVKNSARFMFYTLMNAATRNVFTAEKATISHLTAEKLKKFRFAFPPREEQTAIATYLDEKTTQIDTLIAKTRKQVELLQEYRTALISSVVTGKVDVRKELMS